MIVYLLWQETLTDAGLIGVFSTSKLAMERAASLERWRIDEWQIDGERIASTFWKVCDARPTA